MKEELDIIQNNLPKDVKDQISGIFEKMMNKFSKMGNENTTDYFSGVVDGINNCWKVINGIDDDYSDNIK